MYPIARIHAAGCPVALNGLPGLVDTPALPGVVVVTWQLWLGCPPVPGLAANTAPTEGSKRQAAIVTEETMCFMLHSFQGSGALLRLNTSAVLSKMRTANGW